MGAAGCGADVEYVNRLLAVMKKHPNLDVKPFVHHEDMGFEPHEKQAIEKEIPHGNSHKELANAMASKGQVDTQIRQLHKVASNLTPGYKDFADDLAVEFHF